MPDFPKYMMPYSNPILKKKSTQFFKGVVHEQPWSSTVCLLWWSSIVSSFFLEVKNFQNHSLLSFSFPLLITFFFFLAPFLWNSQKCPISQNIWCLIKTQWKNSIHAIFQGSSPWATLILNSMFVVVALYCVQLFLEAKIVQNHSLLSFSFPLL